MVSFSNFIFQSIRLSWKMLISTFTILNGVGERTERRLWRSGLLTWQDFLDVQDAPGISPDRKGFYDEELYQATGELERHNSRYFLERLQRREQWRLYKTFKKEAVFLDIETAGLSPDSSEITVVGLYDGERIRALVNGIDLSEDSLAEELSQYKMLITFYGSAFDLPFLLQKFPRLDLRFPHFDLCFAGRRVGLKGGLKGVEMQLGIRRDEEVQGLDGYDAVKLWYAYKSGSLEALELLLKYNEADIRSLPFIAEEVYQRLREGTGIEAHTSPDSLIIHQKIHG